MALLFFAAPRVWADVGTSITHFREQYLSKPVETKFFMEVPSVELNFKTPDGSQNTPYRPNALAYGGVGLGYSGFSLSVSTKIPGTGDNTQNKGNTDNFDLNLSHAWKSDYINGFYQDYRGFYIDGTANNGVYTQRPDVTAQNISINYYHAFSDAYDMAVLSDFKPETLKKGGSFLAGASVIRSSFCGDSPFTNYSPINQVTSYSTTLGAGYAYLWPFKDSFLSLEGLVEFGPQWQALQTLTDTTTRVMPTQEVFANVSYARKLGDWLVGLSGKFDDVTSHLGSEDLESMVGSALLYGQTRF